MSHANRILAALFATIALVMFAGVTMAAKPSEKHQGNAQGASEEKHQNQAGKHQGQGHHNHHNGKDLLGNKIKANGRHDIETKGNVTASVEVRDGKIAGLHAKHASKGELPVKKYKTNKKMAVAEPIQADGTPRLMTVQDQYVGTVYIGYSYVNDYGEEDIYWFPYDMILDGDTGAIEYVESA